MYWSALAERATGFADLPAIRAGQDQLSYGALFGTVEALAARLQPRIAKAPSPQRCRVTASTQLGVALGMLTAMRLGLSPIATRPGAPAKQLAEIDAVIRPALQIGDADFTDLPPPAAEWDCQPRLGSRDELFMIMTSGSTGAPKLAARPAESLRITSEANARMLDLTPKDKVACPLSLTYAYGLGTLLFGTLWSGAELVLFEARTSPRAVMRAVRDLPATVLAAPPSLHRLLLESRGREALPGMRLVAFAGEPFTPSLLDDLRAAYPQARLLNHLGITEAGATIAHIDLPDRRAAAGCIGKPLDFIRYRLEGIGEDEINRPGRLMLSGPSLFLGYVQPDGGYDGLAADGWFITGDLVSRDEAGCLYHHGRADRQFKSMGRMINPDAIERAVRLGVPGVADVMCRAEPDAVAGQVPVVLVQCAPNAECDAAAVLAACRTSLDDSQLPERVEFVERFDVAASGKRERR